MRFRIVSVGRHRADPVAPLTQEYVNRIAKFFPIDDIVLKPDKDDKIAAKMLSYKTANSLSIALDERGKQEDSHAFSKRVDGWLMQGIQTVNFLIGGAEGLPRRIKQEADSTMALSKMTLPHRLAHLLIAEQLYRALCIIRNVPYQK